MQKVIKKAKLKRCARCIMVNTVILITFDENGVCSQCLAFDKKEKTNLKNEKII